MGEICLGIIARKMRQDGRIIFDDDITDPDRLVDVLRAFFAYEPPAFEQWHRAVAEFKEKVPELAQSVLALIREEKKRNKPFVDAFAAFMELVREAINPNISEQAVEEMLIQHLLTERIFRTVFNNPDFAQRNIIAREIEKVITALTSRHFSRYDFLRQLDRFYGALETTAATIQDFSEKQDFLNTVYEKFFQGFSVKVADTHGIVYTPQPIVEFMVRSVDDILRREFGKEEGLASEGVALLDPFVGTGNFVLHLMRHMPKSRLPHKYRHELFCNEVMLLPYYIASMNIEHEYYELTGRYEPFEGLSLVDTFELAEGRQMPLFVKENTQRVQRQKNTPIFVIIGNPPYNAKQINENDNNKNRKYDEMDRLVRDSYAKDSSASDTTTLGDPYVKAFRWASDRLGDEGIVAYISNSSFLDGIAFDGMRKNLLESFNKIYILDLGGNVRKNPKISGTTHNVFGIQVGVCISLLIREKSGEATKAKIYYHSTDEFWRKEEKYKYIEQKGDRNKIEWTELEPDSKHNWLTADLRSDYDSFLPIGTRTAKSKSKQNVETIFKLYSLGNDSGRDAWVYNFDRKVSQNNANQFAETFNSEVDRWFRAGQPKELNTFLISDDKRIKWTRNAKRDLRRGKYAKYSSENIRTAMYRPFTPQFLHYGRIFSKELGLFPKIFPKKENELENLAICLRTRGNRKPFHCLATNRIVDLHFTGDSQCFPFYTYDEDGRNRRENITDWALAQFRETYQSTIENRPSSIENRPSSIENRQSSITKWHIFHYVYALLHHPAYRETYAANLRRELPRIPFVRPEHFWGFVTAGERLAHIHVHYEEQPEYPLRHEENPDLPLDYRVEKMRLSRDKRSLKYNDFLTLHGIPPQVFDYKLGNRSALDWIIDQYRVKTDKRSGITNDPNNLDDETYILRLIKQVVTVSLETVQLVKNLPPLEILEEEER